MKIIGFTYVNERTAIVLKGDSSLLVNRKPLFTPDWTVDLRVTPCVVLRVCRLGKSIEPRYANRYYDAVAPGADFVAWDKLGEAIANGDSWTPAMGFDYSLAVGEWMTGDGLQVTGDGLVVSIEEAIAEASRLMTIRQGDLIYIQQRVLPRPVKRDEVIEGPEWAKDKLYCKIK